MWPFFLWCVDPHRGQASRRTMINRLVPERSRVRGNFRMDRRRALHGAHYHLGDVLAKGEGRDGLIDRQHLLQELRRHAVTHERSPLRLQEEQLRQRAVRKQLGQGTKRLAVMRSACAMVQPRTSHCELAEDGTDQERVITLGAKRLVALRTSPLWQ